MACSIGIDFGTSNTVVCLYKGVNIPGVYEDITEQKVPIYYPEDMIYPASGVQSLSVNGKTSLPSVACLAKDPSTPGTKKRYVGTVAESMINNPNNMSFLNFKRAMGTDFDLGDGNRAVDIARDMYRICFYSAEVALEKSGSYRGVEKGSQSVCVSHPASYNPFATVDTVNLAKVFGYSQTKSIEEPKAALLSYLYDVLRKRDDAEQLLQRQTQNGGYLVFGVVDIGGGTTDVTIQRLRIEGQYEPKAKSDSDYTTGYVITFDNEKIDGKQTASNPYFSFGGLDFDKVATEHVLRKINHALIEQGEDSIDVRLNESRRKNLEMSVLIETKMFKENIDNPSAGRWNVPAEVLRTDKDVFITWTKEEYNEWVAPLCKSDDDYGDIDIRKLTIRAIVENTLTKCSGYNAEDLDCLFVTGGMSCYQPIRNMLTEEYGDRVRVVFSDSPDFDIARGAAVYNSFFEVKSPYQTINEGIMIDIPVGEPLVLIRSGDELPVVNKIIENAITITNPVEIHIDILGGQSAYDNNMRFYKRMLARNIEPTKEGTPIDVKYSIYEDRRITLSLHVKQNGSEYDVPIEVDDYRNTY